MVDWSVLTLRQYPSFYKQMAPMAPCTRMGCKTPYLLLLSVASACGILDPTVFAADDESNWWTQQDSISHRPTVPIADAVLGMQTGRSLLSLQAGATKRVQQCRASLVYYHRLLKGFEASSGQRGRGQSGAESQADYKQCACAKSESTHAGTRKCLLKEHVSLGLLDRQLERACLPSCIA